MHTDDFEFADLKLFAAISRAGGINRAALDLNTVQSNVTKKLQALERKIGTDLFTRHRGGMSLTEAGRRLLPYVGLVEQLLREARAAAMDSGRPKGMLRIGSMETTAAIRLPSILMDYATEYPDVDVTIRTGTSASLKELVLAKELDGALIAEGGLHPDLETTPIFRERMVLLVPRSYGRLADLAKRPELKVILFRTGCSYRERLEALLWSHGVSRLRYLEFGTLDGILGCVAAGMGVTLLPRAALGKAMGDVVTHELEGDLASISTTFIRRRDGLLTSAMTVFIEAMERHAETMARRQPDPDIAVSMTNSKCSTKPTTRVLSAASAGLGAISD